MQNIDKHGRFSYEDLDDGVKQPYLRIDYNFIARITYGNKQNKGISIAQ